MMLLKKKIVLVWELEPAKLKSLQNIIIMDLDFYQNQSIKEVLFTSRKILPIR
jgi:hypothetical protein